MKNQKPLIIGFIAVVLATVAGAYFGLVKQDTKQPEPALSTEVIAQFFTTRLNDESGKPYAIEQWRGKMLVVNFWATWCQPCREEMPAFSRLQSKYAASGVLFVGIALDNPNNVAQFKKSLAISYPY
jgi:thiol-disulfide isomerase/thioredoxin